MQKKTIAACIIEVLKDNPSGMTVSEIYDEIIKRNLYAFGAKDPKSVVSRELRRHCINVTISKDYSVKYFQILGKNTKNRLLYGLYDGGDASLVVQSSESEVESDDELPLDERIEELIEKYNSKIKESLLERIMENDPTFFENLVVDLLLKMGYGYSNEAGLAVGKSHDGGIDGIIYEDKLGLDMIYIQAKRYNATNTVGRKELQSFIGAMLGVQKGVFLTTSSYTREAINYIKSVKDKHVTLIDGEKLVSLMLKNNVGVQLLKSFDLYEIDNDYFN